MELRGNFNVGRNLYIGIFDMDVFALADSNQQSMMRVEATGMWRLRRGLLLFADFGALKRAICYLFSTAEICKNVVWPRTNCLLETRDGPNSMSPFGRNTNLSEQPTFGLFVSAKTHHTGPVPCEGGGCDGQPTTI
jgi:hypothetical protein